MRPLHSISTHKSLVLGVYTVQWSHNVEIIHFSQERRQIASYRTDMETAILETISRRPLAHLMI